MKRSIPLVVVSCLFGAAAAHAGSSARLFLVPDVVTLDAEVVMGGGVTQTFEIFLENTAPDNSLRGYQVVLNDGAGGDSGSVDYEPVYVCNGQNSPPDLGSVCTPGPTACSSNPGDCDLSTSVIDTSHPDYVFASAVSQQGTVVDPGPPTRLASAVADAPGDSVAVTTPVYLGEVTYAISSDATGSFTIDFVAPGSQMGASQTILANASSALFDFATDGAVINIESNSCTVVADCADSDTNNVRDDSCVWSDCDGGSCTFVDIIFADMGGSFGACPPDGFTNLFDRTHALTCFAGTSSCSPFMADAGGAFGACAADGFCNLFDATHALTAFAGTNPCTCPANPAPEQGPVIAGGATLTARADRKVVRPGEQFAVRIYVDQPLNDLQGYQLDVEASGGRGGSLRLVDIVVEEVDGRAFDAAENHYQAVNLSRGQMLHGLEDGGVATAPAAYLATYIYSASRDASGTFVVDVRSDEAAGDQSYLVSDFTKKIEILGSNPAVIAVQAAR